MSVLVWNETDWNACVNRALCVVPVKGLSKSIHINILTYMNMYSTYHKSICIV